MTMKALGFGLGHGLDDLLGKLTQDNKQSDSTVSDKLISLDIKQLKPGKYQPRQTFNDNTLAELAESIRAQGIIQPLVVRLLDDKNYEIIAGERRWRAAQLAGLQEVPVVVRDVNDDIAALIALIENIQREDLNIIQEAEALQRLQDGFTLTHQQIASAVGKSRASVTNILRLINLHPEVKQMLNLKQLEMGHARALLALSQAQQPQAALQIVNKKLSVRATEALVKNMLMPLEKKRKGEGNGEGNTDTDIKDWELAIAQKLKLPVSIKMQGRGGCLTVKFRDIKQLQEIL